MIHLFLVAAAFWALRIFTVAFWLLALACVFLTTGGDNSDAHALAGMFWLPAAFFALPAAIGTAVWVFR